MKKSCPSEERLVDYFEGRLSKEDKSQLEAHLAECQDCLEALVTAKNMIAEMDRFELEQVPRSVTDSAVKLVLGQFEESAGFVGKLGRSAKEMVSRLTDTLLGRWGVLQPVPIRGAETPKCEGLVCHTVYFKGIEAEIEIEQVGEGRAHIRVKPSEVKRRLEGMRVTLKKRDREISSYLLEEPYVLFEDIPFGYYTISLVENGAELGTYYFEIKDTREEGGK